MKKPYSIFLGEDDRYHAEFEQSVGDIPKDSVSVNNKEFADFLADTLVRNLEFIRQRRNAAKEKKLSQSPQQSLF